MQEFREPLPPNRSNSSQSIHVQRSNPGTSSSQQYQDLQNDHTQQRYSTAPNNMLSKEGARNLLQNLDPFSNIDPKVEQYIGILMEDFLQRILKFSYHLAQHRNSKTVSREDIMFAAESLFNVDEDQMREDVNKIMNQMYTPSALAITQQQQQQQQQQRYSNLM